ncbi:MAG: penicillin-binding protein 1C [Steroidobacteraceae bacterium]
MWRPDRRTLGAGLIALLLAGALGFALLLPRPLFRDPLSAVLLARDGSLLGARIAADGQWRFPESGAVPARFAAALMEYEDRRFLHHPGVDPMAVVRALRSNFRARHVVSGASTLTMQLARLVRAQGGAAPARSYAGKLWEMLLALRLELAYDKPALLALYASHAPFGGNVVGLEAAAWRYFGRAPEALSWAEAATLAVLPNSPALVTPGRNRTRLAARRDALLARLAARGYLTAQDLELARAEPLVAAPLALPDYAPHLLETLRRRHPQQNLFHTTLDAALQRAASARVAEHAQELADRGIGNAAALVVDNRSFEVLAYVGNAGWATAGPRALAVDIVQRPRSTGSILKPFLYAAMLDSGQLLPQMLVPDIPTRLAGFAPENFDRSFRGAVPADEALALSLNVPAVRLLREYGYPRFHALLRDMGFSDLSRPADYYGLALILGGAEARLWDVAGAYAQLADRARAIGGAARAAPAPLRVLREPESAADESRVSGQAARRWVFSTGAAWLTQMALLEVPRPQEEAHWRSFASSRHIAWKTGTSWGLRDAWAVGSDTRHTVAVWTGNADGRGVPGLVGGLAAAPLLFALHDLLEPAPWYVEPVGALKTVQVCADDGYLASELCTAKPARVPVASHFDQQTPWHRLEHLSADGRYRVHAGCERVALMRHVPWLVLPPAIEWFYRRQRGGYRPLPPLRPDCMQQALAEEADAAMEFLYPGPAGKIFIPVDLDGRRGRAVFEVAHRDADATVYWHMDESYVGETRVTHQLVADVTPGAHSLTVVDDAGRRLTRRFEVLSVK